MRSKEKENYLELQPVRIEKITWSSDQGKVTLEIENKGFWNRLFQKLLKKPKISYIHLDEMGSFLWPLLEGEKTVSEIGQAVKEEFGDKAEPLYERLVKYLEILKSYRFIQLNK